MKIFLFFIIIQNFVKCENLSKIDLDKAAIEYSNQEKKPEQIEILENSDILQDAMTEINKTQETNEPIALSPEVVSSLLNNLNYLRKQKQFPALMQDENFEKDFKDPHTSDKVIKKNIYQEKIRQQKIQLLSFREKIKELIASIDRIKRSQKRGDQQELHKINQQLEEYEKKYEELQHKLFDKKGKPTNNEDHYTELVQHIDIIKAKIDELSDKLIDMQLKDFDDKDLLDIKQLIYEYQLILKDLLQQRVDYLKLKEKQQEQLEKEIEINELNKEKTAEANESVKEEINKKQKQLQKDEEELEREERLEQAHLDLEQEMEILHEKERIPSTKDEQDEIREEEEKIKDQLKDIDLKLMGNSRINKIMLKYKLDTKINPSFHNIDPILDDDYKNTENISDKLYNTDLSLTSYRDLFRLQFKLNNLFKDYLTNIDQIPQDIEMDEDENFGVLDKLTRVTMKMKNDFESIEKLHERIERAFESFDPHRIDWVNFYDQKEFQQLTMEKAKEKKVNRLEISENEQAIEEYEQQSISDIEKVNVCITDLKILFRDMDQIKDKYLQIIPADFIQDDEMKIQHVSDDVTIKGFKYAKKLIKIRVDLEENLNLIMAGMISLQSRKDQIFDKIEELNNKTKDEREQNETEQTTDVFDFSSFLSSKLYKILSLTIILVLY